MLIKAAFNITLVLAACGWVVILLGAVLSVMAAPVAAIHVFLRVRRGSPGQARG